MPKRKQFEELTIQDDFMFCKVMQNMDICKKVLELVLEEELSIKKSHHKKQWIIDVGNKPIITHSPLNTAFPARESLLPSSERTCLFRARELAYSERIKGRDSGVSRVSLRASVYVPLGRVCMSHSSECAYPTRASVPIPLNEL